MKDDYGLRILRVRLFELGHSFEEIDAMKLRDMGDITSYWHGKGLAEKKLKKQNATAKGRRH